MQKKTFFRIIFFFLLFVLFSITAIQFRLTFFLNNKIKNHLLEEIKRQTNGEYRVEIRKMSVNVFTKSIQLMDFVLINTDMKNYSSLKLLISAPQIKLDGFQLLPLLLHKRLIIQKIELTGTSGYIYRRTKGNSESLKSKRFSFYQLFRKYINSFEVIGANITDADIRIYNDENDVPFLTSHNNRLKIANLKINSITDSKRKLFQADSLKMEINNIKYTQANSFYFLQIEKMNASYSDSKISLDSIKLIPAFNKKDFAAKVGHQTDWIKISVPQLVFNRMEVKTFFESNQFIAKSLSIKKMKILSYRDKNVEQTNES